LQTLIKVILFDLGGVLVDWDGKGPLVELSGGKLNKEEARRFWLESILVRQFETGRLAPDQFAEGVVSELGLSLSPDKFLEEFVTWDRGLYPGVALLLDKLRPRFLLACLSNNNELHWKKLIEDYALTNIFHRLYASFQTGLMKPDREAFENVINDLGYSPEEFLFFDDNLECIEEAEEIGMKACQVRGIDEVRKVLKAHKIEV